MEGKMDSRQRERNDCFLLLLVVSLLGLTSCGGGGTVRPTAQPNIVLSPANLSFTGVSGGTAPTGQTLTVGNTGTATLNWTATAGQSWCHVSPASGSIAASGNSAIAVTVDAPTSVGKFSCTISVADPNADNSPQGAAVAYTVSTGPCPTGNVVSLMPAVITVGGTSVASAPSGFTGGTFYSDNTAVAAVSGATVTGEAQGSTTISGNADWTYTNGATSCSLGKAPLVVNFNHLTYRTPQVDGKNVNDRATAVAVTALGALRIMADAPAIPGTTATSCGLALYDDAHNLLDSWSNSPTACQINQIVIGADGVTLYAAGWQQTDINNTATRSAMVWQVGLASDTLNVLALADFQLPTTGPGVRTEAQTINVQNGLLYVGTNSDYRLQDPHSGWYSSGGWIVVLNAANGTQQQDPFTVNGYGSDVNFTNPVTGVAMFPDHLWTVSAGQLNGNPVHGYALDAYSLTGTPLTGGEAGNPIYNCRLFNDGSGHVLWGCAAYWGTTNQSFTIIYNTDNPSDYSDRILFSWWGDNGNDTNALSVNIATSSTLNPPGQGGLTMAGFCSRVGATAADLFAKSDACVASFAFSGTWPAQKSWKMRLDEANTPGGSVFGWNDITSYTDQQGVLHDVFVGTGSDGTVNCGSTPCTQAVIGDYAPPR